MNAETIKNNFKLSNYSLLNNIVFNQFYNNFIHADKSKVIKHPKFKLFHKYVFAIERGLSDNTEKAIYNTESYELTPIEGINNAYIIFPKQPRDYEIDVFVGYRIYLNKLTPLFIHFSGINDKDSENYFLTGFSTYDSERFTNLYRDFGLIDNFALNALQSSQLDNYYFSDNLSTLMKSYDSVSNGPTLEASLAYIAQSKL